VRPNRDSAVSAGRTARSYLAKADQTHVRETVMKREPLLTIGTITSVLAAVLALVVAFGVPLTDGQVQALLGLAAALAPVIVALLARSRVTPVAGGRRRAPRKRTEREPATAGAGASR
jgi:Na+/proline symporter